LFEQDKIVEESKRDSLFPGWFSRHENPLFQTSILRTLDSGHCGR